QAHVDLLELRQRGDDLARDEVKASRPRGQPDLPLNPHHSTGSRATRMFTRSPTNGTPSASSSTRCRPPFASEPSARTIRCHGSDGSWQSWSTAPATRGAPGETSP